MTPGAIDHVKNQELICRSIILQKADETNDRQQTADILALLILHCCISPGWKNPCAKLSEGAYLEYLKYRRFR